MSTDIPVPGDYGGKTDPAVHIPSRGQWWALYSGANYATITGPVS